ncbi:transketolase [Pseudomonas grimontii]|jgi:transketolase|uniref:transketolase n=1 Tax=Pseudomonas grimontii TaxID=129847 RepID=UPI0028E50F3E|nr:transketolase [Pseudomonas grimontii]
MNAFQYDAHQIKEQARLIRRHVIRLNADSPAGGHTGADLSETDILATLYFRILNTGPERTEDPERDIYIQSKGHGVGGLYCCLAQAGYIPTEWLPTYQHFNSHLPGHPVRQKTPGIELNTGALGHGLPVAVGLALAAKMSGSKKRIYVLTGDGELAEGSNWEAAMAAAKYGLDNLFVIVDKNKLQLAGLTADIMPLDPLDVKWAAFGFRVSECDGNDVGQLIEALETMQTKTGAPQVLIAHTIKGKGVSFIEARPEWHHRVPKGDEINAALEELNHGE